MIVDRKFLEKNFEKFSTATIIRVFNFIRTSQFLVERIFWILLLLVFSYATAWSVTGTFKTFVSEPTASQIAYVSNSTSGLHFDDAMICFEILPDNLQKLYENKINKSIIEKHIKNSNFVKTLDEMLHVVHRFEDLRISELGEWLKNQSDTQQAALLDAYHAFESSHFEVFTEEEVALVAVTTAMFVRLIDLESEPKPFYVDWQSKPIEELFWAYVGKGTNFSDLFRLTAETTCAFYQIRIVAAQYDLKSALTDYEAYNFCKDIATVSYFGVFGRSDTICYRLARESESPLNFYSTFDSVMLTMHPESLYKEQVEDLKHISIDLQGDRSDEKPLSPVFNTKQIVEFSLETESVIANLRRRECADRAKRSGTLGQCRQWCRVESIIRSCECEPIFRQFVPDFAPLPKHAKSCAVSFGAEFNQSISSTIPACQAALRANYDQLNCSRRCVEDCENLIFTSTVRTDVPSFLLSLNATTVVVLKSTKFVYQRFSEYITMDFKGLIAALGGNLSLYLGASFLALIHIVIFIVRLPFEKHPKPKADVKKSLSQECLLVGNGCHADPTKEALSVLLSDMQDLRERIGVLQKQIFVLQNFHRIDSKLPLIPFIDCRETTV